MRRISREAIVNTIARQVQGYHEGGYGSDTNYAFLGYNNNLYFTSDRTIKLDTNFRPLDKNGNIDENKILKGYGWEIEMESWGLKSAEALVHVLKNICFQGLNKDLFKFQRDGSLCGGSSSVEAITQVMTKEYIRNNYPNFKSMYQWFDIYEISAARSGNCGMHVNLSNGLFGKDKKTQIEAIRKLIYIVNKYYKEMCILVKRDINHTDYCRKMPDFTRKEFAKSYDLERYGREGNSCHGICFNYAHFETGRVELRLVGGQPNYYALRNTMETIFHLVDIVKTISWDKIDSIVEVFRGCNKYVVKRISDLVSANLMSRDTYNEIVRNSDTETDFGNF